MSLSSSLLWRGLIAIVIGVVSVAWPGITVGAFVILFAVYAFMAAAMETLRAFSSTRVGPVFGYLLLAVLSLIAGIVALAWPGITALVLVVWVGSWAVITGVVEVALGFRRGESAGERTMWAITGLVSLGFGIVLFIRPDIGAVSLATVFGLFSIFYGTSAVVLSTQTRKVEAAANKLIDSAA
ncbi:HdeD family acid-resistance protein [Dactylosporangium sp. CA-092794]|uniref:HdeD family acid-resistance protein n=1 Tax=Dactylosporangium sp. CA-092794 TaxID=3239929 RepID=UPI003D916557